MSVQEASSTVQRLNFPDPNMADPYKPGIVLPCVNVCDGICVKMQWGYGQLFH